MRFLVDAQLPRSLKTWLLQRSIDAIHTDDLPNGSRTSDTAIADLTISDDRVLISKDSDFLRLKILRDRPKYLLIVTTGNITNVELLSLFEANFELIVTLFATFEIVELSNIFVSGRNLD
jgi:predicted nuclease of predicted toxin-antitoxin system